MPVSPAMAEGLAAEVARLYEDAEAVLLERLAAALEADIENPRWAELKLAAIGNLRTAVEDVANALQQDTNGAVRRALIEAYNRGRQATVAELGALDIGRELVARETLPNAPAVDRLAASMAADTRPVYARITRAVVDVYRRIVSGPAGNVLLGTMTRRQASQRALNQFAQRGITGFRGPLRARLGHGVVRRDGRPVRHRPRGRGGPRRCARRDGRGPGGGV
ncbi:MULTISPECIES: phage minor capsid protein [Streptomyces]|uniref:Phage minor capsid protein 2 n=1 Tax=Streptomyces chartreusis NRRL 3882 TaxID=1079985 RepID=A0A2N9BB43_STRCX|nr:MULTISPECIES: phage minor capsid protein [Streptomyces]SOR80567.1 Phage minor capsid protein 2 [Streptomyces chartreusis NRRL 3882]